MKYNWSKNKTYFVLWKNYMLILFRNELYFIFSFHFELQQVYLNQDKAGKNLESFKTSRLNTTFSLTVLLWCTPRWRRHLGYRLTLLSMRMIVVMISLKLCLIIRQRFCLWHTVAIRRLSFCSIGARLLVAWRHNMREKNRFFPQHEKEGPNYQEGYLNDFGSW